jgi:hypothetical protein
MQVNIHKLPCFSDRKRIAALNRLVATSPDLMAHQVAAATGCLFEQAMQVLMLLYDLRLAEAFILVYHDAHPDTPPAHALRIHISDGLPSFPLRCPLCEGLIESSSEARGIIESCGLLL